MDKRGRRFGQDPWYWTMAAALITFLLSTTVASQGPVHVAFELPQPEVTVNEPVYVTLSIQNGLREAISFQAAHGRDSYFDLSVIEPNGPTTHPEPPLHGGIDFPPSISIPANGRAARTVLLNDLYQFRRTGDYKLKIMLMGSLRTTSGKLIRSPSQELTLSVAPRDPKRLEDVCRALATRATGTSNYAALKEAAVTLSFVEDPVAVPYLADVLAKDNSVSDIAVRGLVRVGSPEALQVLRSNLSTSDAFLRMQIEGAIQEIETGVHPQIMD